MASRASTTTLRVVINPSGAIAGASSIVSSLRSIVGPIVEVTKTFQSLRASLNHFEGGAAAGGAALKKIAEIAKETPFSVEQVGKAWVRLRTASLTASADYIKAWGNIASAIPGKQINDFVEAVADATMGQSRRLLEFGIKMEKDGGKVRLTMGDLTKTVKNDGAQIEQALKEISEAKFGGLMEAQAKTLTGSISRLEESFDLLLVAIGEGGLAPAIQELADYLTEIVSSSDGTAKELGAVLGDAVRWLTENLRYLIEHSDELWASLRTLGESGTELAKEFGDLLLEGVQLLSDGLKFLAEHADEVKTAVKVILALEFVGWLNDVYEASVAAAKSFALLLAANPFLAAAVAAGAAGAAIYEWRQETKQAEEDTKRLLQTLRDATDEMARMAIAAREAGGESAGDVIEAYGAYSDVEGALAALAPKKKPTRSTGGTEKVDKLTKALVGLSLEAEDAAAKLGLVAGDPADIRGLEIETRLMEFRNSLIREGKKVSAEAEAEARKYIETIVDADRATEVIKAQTSALKELRKATEAKEFEAGLLGLSERERFIELKVYETKTTEGLGEVTEEYLATVRDLAGREYDAGQAIDAHAKNMETLKKATEDATERTKKLAEAQNEDLKKALEESHKALKDWVKENGELFGNLEEFAISTIDSFIDKWVDALHEGKFEFKEFAKDLIIELNKIILKALVAQAITSAISGGFGGGNAASIGANLTNRAAQVLHSGGIAGAGGTMRAVSPAAFFGAQRFHGGGFPGLRPNEVPAILEKGEEVLTKEQARKGRGGHTFNINVNVPGGGSGRGDGSRVDAEQIARAIRREIQMQLRGGRN